MYYFLNNQYKKKIIYVGADIVRKLIYRLQNKYPKYKFVTFDLTNDKCPRFDLIIVRDLLIHLSYKDILRVFQNISDSGSKYLLFSNYNVKKNKDILNGNFREINFFKKPFKLKKKDLLYKIYENDNEGYNKEMILVKVKNLKKLFSLNDKI
jgi:chemotaxis methyl-accepting protein methylase